MICPRWVGVSTQLIALTDVVAYLAGVCGQEEALGEAFDIGGPEVMTYREMIERVGRAAWQASTDARFLGLTPRLSSYWLHLFHRSRLSIARPLIEGLRNETVVHDDRITSFVEVEPTPFDEAAREALASA